MYPSPMKALLLSQYNQLDIADLPAPVPGQDEILVRVAACGICGSDVHGYDGTSGRRIPPIVMGHEAAGVVAAVGTGVSKFKPGDRVTFDSTVYCGQCEFCLQGEINLCNNRQVVGVSCGDYRRAGAFAEYVVVPQRITYHLPEALEFQEAAMLEAVSVALHAVRVSEMKGGETALVIGAGMIGLLTLQAAKAAGASKVLIADIDRTRLETGRKASAPTRRCCFPEASWCRRSSVAPAAEASTWCSKRWVGKKPLPPRSRACARAERLRLSATSLPR